jgi:hypothetical protein
VGHRLGGLAREFFSIDADRKHREARFPITRRHHTVFDLKAEKGRKISDKILAIVPGLESDQIVGQHRLDQLAMMGNAFHEGACRPRRMQEEADRLRHAEIAQFRTQRQEMIILDPEHGIGLSETQQRARHEGVHFAIGKIVFLRGADQIGAGMQRRPQSGIGKALIIPAVMGSRQIQHRQRACAQRFDFSKRFLLGAVADAAARADPNCPGFLHDRQQCGSESPRHGLIGIAARDAI